MRTTSPSATASPAARHPGSAAVAVGGLGALVLCLAALWRFAGTVPAATPGAGALEVPVLPPCELPGGGYLAGELFGDLARQVDWSGAGLRCDGMRRPGDRGLRLMFLPAGDPAPVLVVLGFDAAPGSLAGREVPANLTLVDQGAGRFFSSGGDERCFLRADEVTEMPAAAGRQYRVAGEFYCVGALAALGGDGHVTPGIFRFAGRLSLDQD